MSFVALGLVLALTWFRLAAPDLALAEAAVGSGLTGALMLAALRRRSDRSLTAPEGPVKGAAMRQLPGWRPGAASFSACSSWAVLAPADPCARDSPKRPTPRSSKSGVTNPVTAVLLNYRSYDTLLELGVLLLAVVAVWSLRSPRDCVPALRADRSSKVCSGSSFRCSSSPAVTSCGSGPSPRAAPSRAAPCSAGPVSSFSSEVSPVGPMTGRIALLRTGLWVRPRGLHRCRAGCDDRRIVAFLEYPVERAKLLILLIETAALISIGLTLGCLFYGGRPESGSSDRSSP